jgi:hypothetical protein
LGGETDREVVEEALLLVRRSIAGSRGRLNVSRRA